MKTLFITIIFVVMATFLSASVILAAEYYVVMSRSGLLRIVDHKPQGGGTIVKGPFKSAEEAEKAMKSATDSKAAGGDRK